MDSKDNIRWKVVKQVEELMVNKLNDEDNDLKDMFLWIEYMELGISISRALENYWYGEYKT